MNMRWVLALSVVAIFGLLAAPVLAQMPGGYGARWMGMMGGNMMGGGMGGWTAQGNGQPLSIERAVEIARQAVSTYGRPGLVPGHIMEFTNHFYVAVKDRATGRGAFELLVDRYTGAVHPERGPNMMWNTEYGHMSGGGFGMGAGMMGMGNMMGPGFGQYRSGQPSGPAAAPTVTLDQARKQAQRFLDGRLPGTRTAEATLFPGYYTIDVSRSGTTVGMLSVNANTGQVWYHGWHGAFVQERDVN